MHVLRERASEHSERWLNPDGTDATDRLKPFPAEEVTAYSVSTRVNSGRNDAHELFEMV